MIKSRREYTLIELLVVLAVISILMVMLISAMKVGKEKIKTSQCKDNMRAIFVSTIEYSNDNQGQIVPYLLNGVFWFDELVPYGLANVDNTINAVIRNQALYCPVTGRDGDPTGLTGMDVWKAINPDVGLNNIIASTGEGGNWTKNPISRFATVNSVSEKVFFADTSQAGNAMQGHFKLNVLGLQLFPIGTNIGLGRLAFRHPTPMGDGQDMSDGECNMAFGDGRVDNIHFSDDRVSSQEALEKILWRDKGDRNR